MHLKRIGSLAIAALVSTCVVVPQATAAVDGSTAVISEVYGGGGNKNAPFTHDFIELYNPTDTATDVSGWSVEYFSSKGNSGGKTTLNGSIPAGGYYLIQEGGGGAGEPLPTPDAEGGLSMSGSKGSVKLYDASGAEVDVVGYGEASISEGSPTPALSNTTSAQRNEAGTDTDDNAADFSTAAPTPKSGGGATAPEDPQPENPTPAEPGSTVTIPDIQGTGAESPLKGQTVTTQGVVTAVWKGEKSLNGFTIQTPGTGATAPTEASEAVFVYSGGTGFYPKIGESVEVTGSVDEYYGQTQIALAQGSVLDTALDPVKPLAIDALPEGDEDHEKLESMLLKPGVHTVTDNYGLNRYGELGLAPGTEALRQPTDIVSPGTQEQKDMEASNAAKYVILDDGSTRDFTRDGASTKLPYIMQNGSDVKTIRTTNQVEFAESGVILGYGHNQWRFQPTTKITGDSATADLPITWDPARPEAPQVEGDYTVAAFNVLNFFINLGEDNGAKAYKDRFGNGVGSDSGTFRGAWSESAFNDQKGKILTALEGLDADVIGLSEIENAANTVGGSYDDAVKYLVGELNTRAGSEKWDYVKAPANASADTDVIRTAIIYKKDRVQPVGEATLLEDERFKGTARTPLAAEFVPAPDKCAAKGPDSFVVVTNHFKSKGSVANGDKDTGDGQGNNPNVRNAHAQAVLDGLSKQPQWQEKATFVMGDLNSYSKEDAISIFRNAGYTIPVEELNAEEDWQDVASYQFSGRLGSLDHILANEHVDAQAAQTWNINSDEPIAMEYSRRNYTGGDVFEADNPYRSSDHDPVKVGFNLGTVERSADDLKDCDPSEDPAPTDDARGIKSVTIDDNGHLIITYTDGTTEDAGKVVGSDGKDGQDGADGKDGDKGDKGEPGQDGKDGTDGKDGRGIKSVATNDKAELIITYTDGTSEILGTLAGSKGDQGTPGRDGFDGAPGRDGTDGANGKDGKDGKDGRGIKSVTTDADGNLVITYTDGTSETVKSGDKPAAPAGGSSVSERCLPTVLGLTIPAALAIPLAFLGSFGAKLNIPGLEPVKKQIESITRNFPREAQYAAGGIGLLAALGIIAAACAPTESE
ncbi:ExeM/NucH family extracellular endonuclease [Corynebacterium minutissimum]|uniref:Extracellular nuclease n=1 Tax=Corynebacterium minutissimum TaxID=38301 RepID=A0A376D3C9_9CORY|nr:ExeM/NucH family extracellular endonuclease [Corynebacterium minutissimum]STC80893.1 extracellular nuclease [Corynebacterium minutissimum]